MHTPMLTKEQSSIVSSVYNDGFLKLAIAYARQYQADPKTFEKALVGTKSISMCCTEAYGVLVKLGELEPIDKLDSDTKMTLWNQAKAMCAEHGEGTPTEKKCITLSKTIWMLNTVMQVL